MEENIMTKKELKKEESSDTYVVPMVSDDESCMGEIKINHSVIANIATLSAMQTDGVLVVGKQGLANGIASFFSNKKCTSNGVNISEDEFGNYIIDICVTLKFGCELAKVASEIQQNIAKSINHMTTNGVSKVNVVIDSVEGPEESAQRETEE